MLLFQKRKYWLTRAFSLVRRFFYAPAIKCFFFFVFPSNVLQWGQPMSQEVKKSQLFWLEKSALNVRFPLFLANKIRKRKRSFPAKNNCDFFTSCDIGWPHCNTLHVTLTLSAWLCLFTVRNYMTLFNTLALHAIRWCSGMSLASHSEGPWFETHTILCNISYFYCYHCFVLFALFFTQMANISIFLSHWYFYIDLFSI